MNIVSESIIANRDLWKGRTSWEKVDQMVGYPIYSMDIAR